MDITGAELAIILRTILNRFLEDLDGKILGGEVSATTYNTDFIEGMATIVEVAEAVSGVAPIPQDVLDEMKRLNDES